MSIGTQRATLGGSVAALIAVASAFGFVYLETSSSLASYGNSISSLTSQSTYHSVVSSSLSSVVSNETNKPTTVTLISTVTDTSTATHTVTDTLTNTVTSVSVETSVQRSTTTVTDTSTVTRTVLSISVSTPQQVNVTRKITFFVGNTTTRLGAPEETIRIYNASGWVDTVVTDSGGIATTHVAFTSGEVLTLCVVSPGDRSIATFSLTVPKESLTDALALKRIFVALYVS